MDELTEREVHELVLDVIVQGRLLAKEWPDAGVVPKGTTKSLVLASLRSLGNRQGLKEMDEDRIDLVGDQIRRFANEYREGLGDRALARDVETEHLFDVKAIDLVNLAWRWRQFRSAKLALDDKFAAIKETDKLLGEI